MEAEKRINSVVKIPASLKEDFFRYWLKFLHPFHNLPPMAERVAALLLKKRQELSSAIIEDAVLDKIVLGKDVKQEIRIACGMKAPAFYNIINQLKVHKFIIDERINPKFIPRGLDPGSSSFKLLLYFDLSEKEDSGTIEGS